MAGVAWLRSSGSTSQTTERTLYALSTLVHLAVEDGDQAAALTALAELQTAWPEEGLTEDAEALVAAAGWGAESARSTNPRQSTTAQAHTETSPVGGFRLMAAYPNPFNPVAVVPFELEQSAHVSLAVYDVLGREVAVLVDGYHEAGYHTATFDGTQLASGLYFVRASAELEGGARSIMQRQITLMK